MPRLVTVIDTPLCSISSRSERHLALNSVALTIRCLSSMWSSDQFDCRAQAFCKRGHPARYTLASMRLAAALLATTLSAQTITTLIGTGKPGFDATSVNNPYGLVIGPDGGLYFCDIDNHAVRRFDLKSKQVSTIVGTGEKGNSGDGGPATPGQGRSTL